MSALKHYLTNVVHAKTGLSSSVLVGYGAQAGNPSRGVGFTAPCNAAGAHR
jgi:hypothetical protein